MDPYEDQYSVDGEIPDVTTTSERTSVSRRVIPPQVADLGLESRDALSRQQAAQSAAGDAEAKRAEMIRQEVARYQAEQADRDAAQMAALDLENERIATANDIVEKQRKALEGAQLRDYWADKSTGDKVMAGVAIFLGGLRGGENRAWNMMKSAMDDDRNMQLKRIELMSEKMRFALTGKSNAVAAKRALMAEAAARESLGMKQLQLRLQSLRERSPEEVKARIDAVNAGLEQRLNESQQRIAVMSAPTVSSSSGTSTRPQTASERAASGDGFSIFDSSGTKEIGRIKDKKAWEKQKQNLADFGDFTGLVNDIEASVKKYGKAWFDQQAKGEREGPITLAIGKINQIMRGGILGDRDAERYDKLLQGALYHSADRTLATLGAIKKAMRRSAALGVASEGLPGEATVDAYMGASQKAAAAPAGRPTAPKASAPKSAKDTPATPAGEQGTIVELKDKRTGEIVRARKIPDSSRPAGYRLERL